MRILVPLAQFFAGGQTTHVLTLAKYLSRFGHRVTIFQTHPNGRMQVAAKHYRELIEASGVEFLEAGGPSTPDCLHPFRWDIIHAHSTHDWARARDISGTSGRPYVLTVHGLGCATPENRPSLADASMVIAVGRRVAESLNGMVRKPVVIENGVDLELFRPEPKAVPARIVYASRLDSDKISGVKALLETARMVGRVVPITLYILSTRPSESTKNDAGKNVFFTNWTHQPQQFINAAEVVLGVGRVLREGMASGVACFILGPAYGGLITPSRLPGWGPHDFSGRDKSFPAPSPGRIAADIIPVLTAPAEQKSDLSRAMREYAVRHFSGGLLAEKTVRAYQEALLAFGGAHRPLPQIVPPTPPPATQGRPAAPATNDHKSRSQHRRGGALSAGGRAAVSSRFTGFSRAGRPGRVEHPSAPHAPFTLLRAPVHRSGDTGRPGGSRSPRPGR